MTTFQSLMGMLQLTSIPMGYTNSVQIMHGDITWILQPEIPMYMEPYIDDVLVKGLQSRYKLPGGGFKVTPENPRVCCFFHEHIEVMNQILHHVKCAGGTFSGKKLAICMPKMEFVRHICMYKG